MRDQIRVDLMVVICKYVELYKMTHKEYTQFVFELVPTILADDSDEEDFRMLARLIAKYCAESLGKRKKRNPSTMDCEPDA